jgi:hypothetical protein
MKVRHPDLPIQTMAGGALLPVSGAAVGLDVGYSESKASTGLCVLSWTGAAATWVCRNAYRDDAGRRQTLKSITGRCGRRCSSNRWTARSRLSIPFTIPCV